MLYKIDKNFHPTFCVQVPRQLMSFACMIRLLLERSFHEQAPSPNKSHYYGLKLFCRMQTQGLFPRDERTNTAPIELWVAGSAPNTSGLLRW